MSLCSTPSKGNALLQTQEPVNNNNIASDPDLAIVQSLSVSVLQIYGSAGFPTFERLSSGSTCKYNVLIRTMADAINTQPVPKSSIFEWLIFISHR